MIPCNYFSTFAFEKKVRWQSFVLKCKALHSELLTELSGRFPSWNEYFVISEVRIWRHFFVIFGKFGISEISDISEISEHSEKPVSEISELFTKLFWTFWPKTRVFCPKTSNFTSFFRNFWNLRNFRIITELFSELKFPNFFSFYWLFV